MLCPVAQGPPVCQYYRERTVYSSLSLFASPPTQFTAQGSLENFIFCVHLASGYKRMTPHLCREAGDFLSLDIWTNTCQDKWRERKKVHEDVAAPRTGIMGEAETAVWQGQFLFTKLPMHSRPLPSPSTASLANTTGCPMGCGP